MSWNEGIRGANYARVLGLEKREYQDKDNDSLSRDVQEYEEFFGKSFFKRFMQSHRDPFGPLVSQREYEWAKEVLEERAENL